jgi:uncharacterized protein DUF2490
MSQWRRQVALTFLGGVLLGVPTPAWASDSQLWTTATATVRLSDKWSLSQDFTTRFSDERHGLSEIRANMMLGYRLNRIVTLWAGYTYAPNYSAGDLAATEHRAREQVTFDNFARLGGGQLSGRLRLEQRWRKGENGTGWRLRPFLRYTLPFRKGGKTALTVTEEPFIDLNTNGFQTVRGLERLRTLIGIRTPIARNISAEIGYLNQHGFVRNGKDTNDNVASISLSWNL